MGSPLAESAMSRTLLGILTVLLARVVICGGASARPKVSDEVPNLTFKDIRYLTRSLTDLGDTQALVLVFTNTTCPLAQKYWPKLKRLDEEYRARGVQLVSVNVGAADEIADVALQAI